MEKISKIEFVQYFKELHEYKDDELKEFDNLEEKEIKNLDEIMRKYSKLTDKEKIIKMYFAEKISERKLAENFNITRYEIRKILKQWEK